MVPGGPPLVLASGSAARRALMQAAGLAFTVVRPEVDEAAIKRAMRAAGAAAEQVADTLAEAKARGAQADDHLVIGADQMLVCEGEWFDKPATLDAAREQLSRLRARRHVLPTALVCCRGGQVVWRHLARPVLTMRDISDAFLGAYIAAEGEALLGCVGAYRLEGRGMHLFDSVEGEHSAVLGLPMLPLLGFLRQVGSVLA